MRIIVSHPDSMGDLILREPLYAELLRAGHDLLIVANSTIIPVARYLFPTVKLLAIPADLYGRPPASDDPGMTWLRENIYEFAPECLLFTAYVRTWFDECLHATFTKVLTIGFRGLRYPGSVSLAQESTGLESWNLSRSVEVLVEMHECEKNHRLCEAVLGRRVDWRRPSITASLQSLEIARGLLERHGSIGNDYWVACVGDSECNRDRNWRHERWAELLRLAVERHGWRFVLIGTAEEQAASRAIRDAMGKAADHVIVMEDSDVSFEALTGIVAQSQGYLGRDTGPMHLAAALSKPVLAVFGGGTWPRFIPQTNQGDAFTMEVPCSGCGHLCHFSQYHCVKAVPVEPVLEALDRLAAGLSCEMRVHRLQPAPVLAEQMGREAGAIARDREWLLVRRQEQLNELSEALQQRDQLIAEKQNENERILLQNEHLTLQLQVQADKCRQSTAKHNGTLQELRSDLQRVKKQVTRISSSRWYRIGRKLGLVKPTNNASK